MIWKVLGAWALTVVAMLWAAKKLGVPRNEPPVVDRIHGPRPRIVVSTCGKCGVTEEVEGGHFTQEMFDGPWGKFMCTRCRSKQCRS